MQKSRRPNLLVEATMIIEWLYFFYIADHKIAGSLSETLLCCLMMSEEDAVCDTDQLRKRL